MRNVNDCKCLRNNLRNHHGVVCTTCNNKTIEPLLVPNEITAYRVWKFNHRDGFAIRSSVRSGWYDFNQEVPPVFAEEVDFMKPWSGSANCNIYDHKGPNPYCSCGYYSIKNFANNTDSSFGHDSSRMIADYLNRAFTRIESLRDEEKKRITELLFYSPVAKTTEIVNLNLTAEVSLTGNIIECEFGYRSQYIEPKKFFLLLDFGTLYNLISFLGNQLGKDNSEKMYVTHQWIVFLDNYFTNILKLYGYEFELRLNIVGYSTNEFEPLTRYQSKNSTYYPLRDHPFYPKFRNIEDVLEETNKIMRHKLPSLDEIKKELDKIEQGNLVFLPPRSYAALKKRYTRLGDDRIVSLTDIHYRETIAEFFPTYASSLIAFAHFSVMLSEKPNNKNHLLAYPNLAKMFGFRYHSFLESKYSAEQMAIETTFTEEHPKHYFKGLYPYYLKQTKQNTPASETEDFFDEWSF